MPIDLTPLAKAHRVLFSIPLVPLQGHRFQPTGFPGLGAATFQTAAGQSLLVESAQSMANRLELTIWDAARQDVIPCCAGISHVKVLWQGRFLTDTILEAHRLSSPYLLGSPDESFLTELKRSLAELEAGPVDRGQLARVLLQYDVGSLLHGVFLAKKELAGGRLRVARALTAFVEADGVRVAPSGGVKNDHVNPSGVTKDGFGNVPFARDEFTAERITLFVNLDLAQVRGYGLGEQAERLLIMLGLYKLRVLLEGNLRFRTACDLRVATDQIVATAPEGFSLPELARLSADLEAAVAACRDAMQARTAVFTGELKKGQSEEGGEDSEDENGE